MLQRRADEMNPQPVDMEGAQGVSRLMLVGRADGAPNFAMRETIIEAGGHTPRHSHNFEHEVFILEGSGSVEDEGDFHDVRVGDVLFIAPGRVHQFTNTGQQPLRFLCMVPVSFDSGDGRREPTPDS